MSLKNWNDRRLTVKVERAFTINFEYQIFNGSRSFCSSIFPDLIQSNLFHFHFISFAISSRLCTRHCALFNLNDRTKCNRLREKLNKIHLMLRIQIQIDAAIFIDSKFKFVYGAMYIAYTVDINTIISPLTPTTFSFFISFCFPSHFEENRILHSNRMSDQFCCRKRFFVFRKKWMYWSMIETCWVYVFD